MFSLGFVSFMGFLNFSIFLCCMYSTSVAHQKHTSMYVIIKKATPFCSAAHPFACCMLYVISFVCLVEERNMHEWNKNQGDRLSPEPPVCTSSLLSSKRTFQVFFISMRALTCSQKTSSAELLGSGSLCSWTSFTISMWSRWRRWRDRPGRSHEGGPQSSSGGREAPLLRQSEQPLHLKRR